MLGNPCFNARRAGSFCALFPKSAACFGFTSCKAENLDFLVVSRDTASADAPLRSRPPVSGRYFFENGTF
jgi:hypothetical protein